MPNVAAMEGSYDPVFSGPSTPMSVLAGRRPMPADNVVNMSAPSRSPGAPSGPNQYKANVNRTKTRKWVEAKTIDYGGDDWGGDDYDDEPIEPDEPEPPLPPPSKPQGPRPSTTFSNSRSASPAPAGPRPLHPAALAAPAASPSVSPSPGLRMPAGAPALHIQTQQHPTAQQTTADTGSPWRRGPSRGSTPGTERPKEISPHAVGVPQSATASSVYSAVSEFGQLYGDRGASPGPFQGPRPRRMSPGPQGASSPVPTRFPGRKSSLSQHDAPADNACSPIHADSNQQMGSRPGSSHANAGGIKSPNKPWIAEGTGGGPRSASPSGGMRSPNATGKPLPFVRPSDIYKKLEDEKEKVRRSMDSERPSIDSLGLGQGSDTAGSLRTQSPARTSRNKPQTQEPGQVRPDSEVMSPGLSQVMDGPFREEVRAEGKETTPGRDNDDVVMPRSGRVGLPTVAERKSEYGIEGLISSYEARGGTSGGTSQGNASPLATAAESASAPASREGVPAISSASSRVSPRNEIVGDQPGRGHQVRELPGVNEKEGAPRDEALRSAHSRQKDANEAQEGEAEGLEDGKNEQSGEELRRFSTSPKLPELGRLSVFGFDLFSSSSPSDLPASSSSSNHPASSSPPPLSSIPSSRAIVAPSPPLSTVIESSPSPTLPAQHEGVDQEVKGEASPDRTGPGGDSQPQLSAATDTVPSQDAAGSCPTAPAALAEPSRLGRPEPISEQHNNSSGKSTPDAGSIPVGEGAAPEEPAQGPPSDTAGVPDIPLTPSTLTSKSESEQQPSVDKALPALPSEASVVTPDPQTSQLVISAPSATVSDEHGSSEEASRDASSATDPKLTVHPLLVQHSEQANASHSQVSPSRSSHATSASALSPAPASELTPVDTQALPTSTLPGTSVIDNQGLHSSSSPADAEVLFTCDESNVQPMLAQEKLAEGDDASDTSDIPQHPSSPPPAPPVEITRGETYVTARESPALLGDGGDGDSPTKTDKLSAEILRSLTPAAPNATTAVESSETHNRSFDGPSSIARESSFLPDLYDDYWSFAGTGNAADAEATPALPTNPATAAMPAALNLQAENIHPRSPVVAGDDNPRSVSFLS